RLPEATAPAKTASVRASVARANPPNAKRGGIKAAPLAYILIGLLRYIHTEILLGQLLVGAVGLDLLKCLVDGRDQFGLALGDDDAGIGGLVLRRCDFNRRVGLLLLEVVEREAVVDRGVGAAVDNELDRLVETFGSDQLGARGLGHLRIVAGQRLCRLLALEVIEALDLVIAFLDDQRGL